MKFLKQPLTKMILILGILIGLLVISILFGLDNDRAQAQQLNKVSFTYDTGIPIAQIQNQLNKRAKAGWELVCAASCQGNFSLTSSTSTATHFTLFFKSCRSAKGNPTNPK